MAGAKKKATDISNLMKGAQRSQGVERPTATAVKNTGVSVLQNTSTPESEEPRLNVAIRQTVHKRLKIFAAQNDRQIRDVLETAILEYLDRQA